MNEHDETENLQAPTKLVEALRNSRKERVFVPPLVDKKILAQARQHLLENKSRFAFLPRWAAMAASLVLICGLIIAVTQTRTRDFAAEDINRDGVADILDAFALARKIEAGATGDVDFNRDGVVDQRDAGAIGQLVVRLDKGGRS